IAPSDPAARCGGTRGFESPSTGESTANLISLPGASPAHILRKRRTIGDDRGARVLQEADLPEGGARGSLGRWRRGSLQDRVRLVGRRLQIVAGTPSPCRSSSGWITPASPDAPAFWSDAANPAIQIPLQAERGRGPGGTRARLRG